MSFAIRPNASLNAATAAGGSTLIELLAFLEQARGDDLAVLVDDPRRQSDFGGRLRIDRNPEPPDVDQKLEFGLSDIGHAQRRMRDIVILEALDQPRLQQLRKRIGPHRFRKPRIVLCRREQEALRLQHRDRASAPGSPIGP